MELTRDGVLTGKEVFTVLCIGGLIFALMAAVAAIAALCASIVLFHKMIISTIRSAKKDKSKPFPIVTVILFIICEILLVIVTVIVILFTIFLITGLIDILECVS